MEEIIGCSRHTVVDEVLPYLSLNHQKTLKILRYLCLWGSPEEHASLCQLSTSQQSTKELMERYAKEFDANIMPEDYVEEIQEESSEDEEIENNQKVKQPCFVPSFQ